MTTVAFAPRFFFVCAVSSFLRVIHLPTAVFTPRRWSKPRAGLHCSVNESPLLVFDMPVAVFPAVERVEAVATFDPALAGTPDRTWDRVLRLTPEWAPGPQPLLVVSPHPDDEVLAVGGLMSLHVRAGCDVTVLSITDGAAAYGDWPDLDRIRRRELEQALQLLGGGRIKLVALALADGQIGHLRQALHEAIEVQIAAISRRVGGRPLVVAPYEADGHPDHDAAGAVSAEVARQEQLALIRYPVWTWHHATPAAFADAAWGRVPLDPATRRVKAEAIDCFASQLRPSAREPIVPPHVVSYFKRPYEIFLL